MKSGVWAVGAVTSLGFASADLSSGEATLGGFRLTLGAAFFIFATNRRDDAERAFYNADSLELSTCCNDEPTETEAARQSM
jgi:hypothetical protein